MNPISSTCLVFLLVASSFPATPRETGAARTNPAEAGDPDHDPIPGATTMANRQKLTPFLWYDDNAEEAIRHYVSIFKDSKILSESRWGEGGPVPKGTLMSARFRLAGQEFLALNGGPMYRFTEAFSIYVDCETQAEVDELWEKLSAGGEPGRCGWLKDKYGLSWQIIPTVLGEMLQDKDPARARRVTEAMLSMGKIDIARLQQAYGKR
jgi:predicted 3-demethylubiquinone-9 3-methyltransferase (glyoxalase superfamily)